MRGILLVTVLVPLTATTLAAQGGSPLQQRLDRQTFEAVRAIMDSARAYSVPTGPLADKALEGAAKHVPAARILAAVRQLRNELADARGLLRAGAPGAPLGTEEIVAAADAQRRGVPAADVTQLRHDVPTATSLVVPLTVLGDLIQRGVPADQARGVIEQLVTAGVSAQQIADVPSRMDVGLKVGAPPLDALRSASPIPLHPLPPTRPGATPPVPNRGPGHSL
ncbi:MAG TPA: hypothetical protein VJ992_12640 [Gemmatimonadales bacterium]|nr:hypothetical protein [Gemmatimonadales bacterium]